MITEKNSIHNECIYSDDKSHRYLMSRIWDKEKPIALFITKSSGTANGIQIELTNNIITNNLYKLGYGGYHAVNLCSAIDKSTVPQFDKSTDDISNEKTITIRAVPEQFLEEEKDFLLVYSKREPFQMSSNLDMYTTIHIWKL